MNIVDDSDSRMVYSPADLWYNGGVPQEVDGTTHWTISTGVTASLTFTGTYIEVYGTIDIPGVNSHNNMGPVSTYSIDGAPATTFTGTLMAVKQYKVLFFQSPTLQEEIHTLVITVSAGFYVLDYLQYLPFSNTTATSTPVSTSMLFTSQGQASGATTFPTPVSHSSVNVPTGALVGGIIGAVVLLLLVSLVAWHFRRKSIASRNLSAPAGREEPMPFVPGMTSFVPPESSVPSQATHPPFPGFVPVDNAFRASGHSQDHYNEDVLADSPPSYEVKTPARLVYRGSYGS